MKRMIQLLMIVDVLLFVGGFFFDYYTTSLGLNDRFYGTFVTNHLFYETNTVGKFTAIAFIVLTFLLGMGYFYLFRMTERKVNILIVIFNLFICFYLGYILITGTQYILHVLFHLS